ncbi:MAG TPA: 2-amino-4-hydroxy-6-hydroxymethyldihydropteridine diphosphokinase [Acidimicrobiia bacterium]|nr:2-amino-4-hydroxy-6-hydroxymethyldihydropteridine diphosphokinase [Acidimicrobiia bacterium]
MTRYAVALGSNQGDRLAHLRAAVDEIGHLGRITGISGLYETAPIGGPDQDPYLNAVAVVVFGLGAEALLDGLARIEESRGRLRSEKWGPRTLDLDIVSSDEPVLDTPRLQVPHARVRERRFVLEPLAEIWPDAPVGGDETAAGALKQVLDQDVALLLRPWEDPSRPNPGIYWVVAQMVWFVAIAVALIVDGSLSDPGLSSLVGFLLLVTGVGLVLVAAVALGKARTALPEPAPGASMVEAGPYRLARHPLYGGLILFFLGASLALGSATAAVLSFGLVGFFWLKSSYEERRLRIAYPQYSSYRRQVRRRFLPFLV